MIVFCAVPTLSHLFKPPPPPPFLVSPTLFFSLLFVQLSLYLFIYLFVDAMPEEEGGGVGGLLHEGFFLENLAWAPLVSDTTPAPPQPSRSNSPKLNKKQETSQGSNKKAVKVKEGESEHEIHIWTERERRKKMRNMFANLHSLLPQLPPKV